MPNDTIGLKATLEYHLSPTKNRGQFLIEPEGNFSRHDKKYNIIKISEYFCQIDMTLLVLYNFGGLTCRYCFTTKLKGGINSTFVYANL